MAPRAVEWVLVVFYGPEAHRAAYGRQVRSNRYTKDYIQLSRKKDFLDVARKLFAAGSDASGPVPLTYKWPSGSAPGEFVFNSSDRPHLKWETSRGAPQVWKMSPEPSETTAETIPGDPTHHDFDSAENERDLIADRGAGQPYLVVVKLRDEPSVLHLRIYLENPSPGFSWANLQLTPIEVQALAKKTSQRSALAWSGFQSGGRPLGKRIRGVIKDLEEAFTPNVVLDQLDEELGRGCLTYMRDPGYGIFFDPTRNHDAWDVSEALPESLMGSVTEFVARLEIRFPEHETSDAFAEASEVSAEELAALREQLKDKNFAVEDSTITAKTRGSAQRVFAESVKSNYRNKCAITGITSRHFLVASHIVPWSEDHTIRLDPSNGICLSLLVDRAFEKGYLIIADDLTIEIDWGRVGQDQALRKKLLPYEGKKLNAPSVDEPKVEYLRRRRALAAEDE